MLEDPGMYYLAMVSDLYVNYATLGGQVPKLLKENLLELMVQGIQVDIYGQLSTIFGLGLIIFFHPKKLN